MVRLTQAEVEAHPAWGGFGDLADTHPPMRGWLATEVCGADGRRYGLLQLSDKAEGADFTAEYDTGFHQLRRVNAGLNSGGGWGSFSAGWSRAYTAPQRSTELTKTVDSLRGQTTLRALANRLTLTGNGSYDIINGRWLSIGATARWDAQCCGFHAEYFQLNLGALRQDKRFTFGVELAGIGSMGNFLGQDVNRAGLAGYR